MRFHPQDEILGFESRESFDDRFELHQVESGNVVAILFMNGMCHIPPLRFLSKTKKILSQLHLRGCVGFRKFQRSLLIERTFLKSIFLG